MSAPKPEFWTRVEKTETCWNWTGPLNKSGYGIHGRESLAHRYAYKEAVVPIPDGLELDHLCSNRKCVRPSHLEAVTHAENVKRGRVNWFRKEMTTCTRGHAYTPENLRYSPAGKRVCRTCMYRFSIGRRWQKNTQLF